MATRTTAAVVSSVDEALEELAKNLVRLEKSKFTSLGAYEEPLRSSREVVLKEGEQNIPLVNADGVIKNLNLPEQVTLFNSISRKVGTLLGHGSLQQNFNAGCSPDGREYRNNVLIRFYVYTGELIGPDGVYTVEGLDKPKVPRYQLVRRGELLIPVPEDRGRIPYLKLSDKAIIQTRLPTKRGYFDGFKGAIPTDKELKPRIEKGDRGKWGGIHKDDFGYSVVVCFCGSVGIPELFFAGAVWPSSLTYPGIYGALHGVLGTWKKAA